MPASAVHTFTDPDDFATAVRGGSVEFTLKGLGEFAAKIIRVELQQLWTSGFSDSLPRVAHVALMSGRAAISFRTQPGPRLLVSGVEMEPTDLAWFSENHDANQLSSGPSSSAYMSLPVEEIASVGATMAGRDLTPPHDTMRVTPHPEVMTRLQRLHAAAMHLAETTPEIIANPDAARGLEQALVEAMVGCLSGGKVGEDRSAQRRHSLIMRRFRRAVEEDPGEALYIPELCKAIGVSDRTLRMCCQDQLGMGPKRYLLLRRMSLARRALRDGSPGTTSVTEIATQFGFWQFGRFAGIYKSLFGETPSATLYRAHQ
jgi:AraC-like DNA-binding protein